MTADGIREGGTPRADFIALAGERVALWRTALGTVLVILGLIAGGFAAMFALGRLAPGMAAEVALGRHPLGVLAFLASFLGGHVVLWLVVRLLHRRPWRSLLGPAGAPVGRHFLIGVFVALVLALAPMLLAPLEARLFPVEEVVPRLARPPAEWALWALAAIPLILVQTSAEELLFRGYLLQQLGARFGRFWAWALLPSALFGALHWAGPMLGPNAWLYVLHTFVTGTMLAVVTRRTGDLGAALGLHFANNLVGFLFIAPAGFHDGLALLVVDIELSESHMAWSVLVQLAIMAAAFALWLVSDLRRARRRAGTAA